MTRDTSRLLLDSSYLIAHAYRDDPHHDAALRVQDRFMAGEWTEMILLDGVFAEVTTILQARADRQVAKEFGNVLISSEEIAWLHLGDRIRDVWSMFLTRPHDGLSLVDTALVTIARELGISAIASFDKGFDQVNGLRRVP